MILPTIANIRSWSRVDFDALGYDDDGLQVLLDRAVEYVEQVTGRAPLTDTPATLEALAQEAVQMRVEQAAFQASSDAVEGATDETGVTSFSTPGYSETRGGANTSEWRAVVVNRWRALNDLLILLMTAAKLEEYEALIAGTVPPAFAVTEVDWSEFGWIDPWPGWSAW